MLDFDMVFWVTRKYNTLGPSRHTRDCSKWQFLGYTGFEVHRHM